MTTSSAPASVRFPRAEHRGILLGLSGAQLAVVSVATVIAGAAVFTAGPAGLVLSAVVWAPVLAVGTVRVGGRSAMSWLPLLASWASRRASGGAEVVRSTRAVSSPGLISLPGIPGALVVDVARETSAAIVLDRRAGTITAVLRVTSSGFLLADVAAQDHRVASWGRVLGSLCQDTAVARLQVLHRALPAPARPEPPGEASSLPARIAAEVATSASGDQRETLLAVSLRAGRVRGGRLDEARLTEIDRRLRVLQTALERAELTAVGWLGEASLRRALLLSYDPEAVTLPATSAETATASGPIAVRERWDHVEADGHVHACFWVAEWPRSDVNPGFLQHLLLAPGIRRTVSLTVEPVPPAAALREIRRAKVEHIADAAQRAKIGQVEDEAARAEQADLARRESEIVAGHGDLRFTGVVTISATSAADLASAGAALRSAAAQALCEVRRLDGQHGIAHAAAALPLARRLL